MNSCPSVTLPNGVEVDGVRLAPIEGRPFPQSTTLSQALEMGLLLESREGYHLVYYLRSARVKLELRLRKEP